jgi:putative DNA primase/helicase
LARFAGGTGKGTYIRLCQAMIGMGNSAATELKHLESSRFETSQFLGKTLMIVTDAEGYSGSVNTLKGITGEDSVRTERKYKDPTSVPLDCMVVLAANEPIQSADYTSGLERRRISIPMTHRPAADNVRELLSWKDGAWHGELAAEIPGLITWVLTLPDDRMEALIRQTTREVPSLATAWMTALIDTNPLAEWAHETLICPRAPLAANEDPVSTNVGYAQAIREGGTVSYANEGTWLYANYHRWADNHGHSTFSSRRFTGLLDDLLINQLKLPVTRTKDKDGSRFLGIRIRRSHDKDPLLLETLFPAPMKDGNSRVMGETRTDEGCDGCDGFLQTSSRENTLCTEKYDSDFYNKTFPMVQTKIRRR